jgi:ubiquinone/menaquinone biosynthesis C-methylase UbiE
MNSINNQSYLEKSLQQFESYPYPNIPIEVSPKDNLKLLYEGSLITAQYQRDKTVLTDLSQKVMLDVACGTGATTLTIALANPGAKIVGVDISPESIRIAKERLTYHGFSDAEFHVLALEDLPSLNIQFDYISASDVLYLLPDQAFALKQMGAVLKPDGIIRTNLHNFYQRLAYFRSQELFSRMGLMEDNPGNDEITIVQEFFDALKDNVNLKLTAWGQNVREMEQRRLLSNHLLLNDKGFTVPQMLESIEQAGLELINMVDWRDWNWRDLFKNSDSLPIYLAMGLENADLGEQLCFYDLVQPNKRLLDFWCGHPVAEEAEEKLNWQFLDPERVMVHLHPCLRSEAFRQAVLDGESLVPLNLGDFFDFLVQDGWLDRTLVSAFFVPLLDSSQSLTFLAERWLRIRPINPVTLEPFDQQTAVKILTSAVVDQEALGIVMVSI